MMIAASAMRSLCSPKQLPERFAGWLFTNRNMPATSFPISRRCKPISRSSASLAFLKGPIDIQRYADLGIVQEAAARLKMIRAAMARPCTLPASVILTVVSGLTTSSAQSMNSCATGLGMRFFGVTMTTGHGATGNSTGKIFRDGRLAGTFRTALGRTVM
jgi:hypothetical protein